MNAGGAGVWIWLDRILGKFFPVHIRRWLTMPMMAAFVAALFSFDLALRLLMPIDPQAAARFASVERLVRSPWFLAPYSVGATLLLVFVAYVKPRIEYSYLRSLLFGLGLACLAGESLVLVVPWRH
jgi:hypothetical protein